MRNLLVGLLAEGFICLELSHVSSGLIFLSNVDDSILTLGHLMSGDSMQC